MAILCIFHNFWEWRILDTATFSSFGHSLPLSKPSQMSQAKVRQQFTLSELQESHWRPFSRLERRGMCSPYPVFSAKTLSLLVVLSEHPLPSGTNPLMWANVKSPVTSFPHFLFGKFFRVQIHQNVSSREREFYFVCCLSQNFIHSSYLIFICRVNDDKWECLAFHFGVQFLLSLDFSSNSILTQH